MAGDAFYQISKKTNMEGDNGYDLRGWTIMTQEQLQFQKRMRQLEETSWQECRFVFTDFLNEAEYSDVLMMGVPAGGMTSFGGYESASRVMVRFGDPETLGYEEPFPVTILHISPLMEKFADTLTHRDYLGAILNLGIERRVIGDILIDKAEAYVMCESRMAEYLSENLTRVKHTSVKAVTVNSIPDDVRPKVICQDVLAGSSRIDAVAAQVHHFSRSQAQELLHSGQVFINGRVVQSASAQLHENDIVSVRHYGKFRYAGVSGETRKGNLRIRIERYV